MSRKIVRADEIIELISAEMKKDGQSASVTRTSLYWQEPDDQGCNWDIRLLNRAEVQDTGFKARFIHAVTALRAQYNIPNQE
jgi:hypothetical protein